VKIREKVNTNRFVHRDKRERGGDFNVRQKKRRGGKITLSKAVPGGTLRKCSVETPGGLRTKSSLYILARCNLKKLGSKRVPPGRKVLERMKGARMEYNVRKKRRDGGNLGEGEQARSTTPEDED